MSRSSDRVGLLALAALLGSASMVPGCARRTDAATRRAWQRSRSAGADGAGDDAAADSGDGGDTHGRTRRAARGWARVDELLTQAVDLMAVAPDDATLARLARKWCDVEPEPQQTPFGAVRVCYPDPPVAVDGHALTLEVGSPGVIGLVARDLSAAESRALSRRARQAAQNLCTSPWQAARPEGTKRSAREEFHTCSASGGPMLAIGRYPVREGADVWQVSVAVLGTT